MKSFEPFTLWFTGLPCSGKTTLAKCLIARLRATTTDWVRGRGERVVLLDGDEIRATLSPELGFSVEDRRIQVRRVGQLCRLLNDSAVIAVAALVSPEKSIRNENRDLIDGIPRCGRFRDGPRRYVEVYVNCLIEVCMERDTKGQYDRALKGEITDFTGVTAPYDPPKNAEIVVRTDIGPVDKNAKMILEYLEARYGRG